MTAIPLELPVNAKEAVALADLVLGICANRAVNDDIRARVASRMLALELASIAPHPGSLAQDPIHSGAYYVAADGLLSGAPVPLLLRLAPDTAPASGLFPNPILIGRMRAASGREVIVNAIPFPSTAHSTIRTFVERVDAAFLPRPQGAQSAIAVGNRHPEISLPAAFDAFRALLKSTGLNLASTVQLSATREMTTAQALARREGEDPTAAGHTRVSIEHLYHAGLWAAVRSGWREGYNAEADHFIVTGDTRHQIEESILAVKEAIEQAAGYTKFTTDTSRLFELQADIRHPQAWSDAEVEQRFGQLFPPSDRDWILGEFARPHAVGGHTYSFTPMLVRRLAVKFGRSLLVNEDLYDHIRACKAARGLGRGFDFEPSIDEAETLTTPEELIFYMHWLRLRGRPAQLVPPNLGFKKRQAYPTAMESSESTGVGLVDYVQHKMWPELAPRVAGQFGGRPLEELAARITELAAIARHFNGTLSIHSGSGKQAEVLNHIGRATSGRWNYKISGELQLQLLDVLREQPESSPWRQLYARMAARCNAFAARGAFGAESELAARYASRGLGDFLGDAQRGRVDGNLFLVFWVGNIVGCRDIESPDGDRRFFKEKLDELPPSLLAEVRRRNSEYIQWLARCLLG